MNYGELEFYIQELNFTSKEDLRKQLEHLLVKSSEEIEKGSISTALAILKGISEEELKEIKETINGK